jgi:hypothetical protein
MCNGVEGRRGYAEAAIELWIWATWRSVEGRAGNSASLAYFAGRTYEVRIRNVRKRTLR